jgi:peptidoglycan/LPS O-acetylase OafA/YrhL
VIALVTMHGMLVFASLVVALQFLKFWRLSHDRFFVWFALAFVLLGAGWLARAFTSEASEHSYYVYIPRVLGFLLILAAILDKNRRGSS